MAIGWAQCQAERRALGIGNDVPLRALLASIRRVGAGLLAPLFAGTAELSSAARSQWIFPAASSLSSRTWCSRAQTPASCQSRKRRQQVMPTPQPNSGGNISHAVPVFSTNRMPPSTARSGSFGRPPFGFGRSGGNSGSITAHNSSLTRGFAMPPQRTKPR